jgi:hypothetical protein
MNDVESIRLQNQARGVAAWLACLVFVIYEVGRIADEIAQEAAER